MEPLNRSKGYPYRQIEDTIRKIMAEHVGPMRTENGLKAGLEKLHRIEKYLDTIKVNDLHELMRAHETRSILSVGLVMATAAVYRTESRNKPYHHRLDFPDTDNAKWCGLVVVRKQGEGLSCSFEPT
jgi:succinate dehydrogenase/fumarate reductase flavoprotein subunit